MQQLLLGQKIQHDSNFICMTGEMQLKQYKMEPESQQLIYNVQVINLPINIKCWINIERQGIGELHNIK